MEIKATPVPGEQRAHQALSSVPINTFTLIVIGMKCDCGCRECGFFWCLNLRLEWNEELQHKGFAQLF